MISEVKQHVTNNFYKCMSASSFPNDVEQKESNQANGVVTITVKELQELRKLVTDLKKIGENHKIIILNKKIGNIVGHMVYAHM